MIKAVLGRSAAKGAGFSRKDSLQVQSKKPGKARAKRFSSPFKKKRLMSGKQPRRQHRATSFQKSVALQTQALPSEALESESVVYSSVMYKYHNNAAKRVNRKIVQIRRNILSDAKKHSAKKNRRLGSLSKSLKKKVRALPEPPSSRARQPPKPSVRQELMPKFETFRKQTECEDSPGQSETIYETIRKASQKIRAFNRSRGSGTKPGHRNFSSSSKGPTRLRGSRKKKSRRNISSLGKVPRPATKFRTGLMRAKATQAFKGKIFDSRRIVVNQRKSFFRQRPRNIKIKVEKEYNLNARRTQHRNSSKLNHLRTKYRRCKKGSRRKVYTSAKSNETLKIEAIANSLNVNLDSLTETIRNKSELDNSSSLENPRELNRQLLEELKVSQMQNAKFTRIIQDLQTQIRELKKAQNSQFSFKNLSSKESSFNPTVESGRNSVTG